LEALVHEILRYYKVDQYIPFVKHIKYNDPVMTVLNIFGRLKLVEHAPDNYQAANVNIHLKILHDYHNLKHVHYSLPCGTITRHQDYDRLAWIIQNEQQKADFEFIEQFEKEAKVIATLDTFNFNHWPMIKK
jgi:hypothetical protein